MARTAILYIAQNCNQQCVFCLEEDGSWNEFVDPETQEVDTEIARLNRIYAGLLERAGVTLQRGRAKLF